MVMVFAGVIHCFPQCSQTCRTPGSGGLTRHHERGQNSLTANPRVQEALNQHDSSPIFQVSRRPRETVPRLLHSLERSASSNQQDELHRNQGRDEQDPYTSALQINLTEVDAFWRDSPDQLIDYYGVRYDQQYELSRCTR